MPDLAVHVQDRRVAEPGGVPELLDLTATLAAEPLPAGRPLWRLVVVTGLADGRGGLVWLSHHAAGDGPSTLAAVLAALTDEAAGAGEVANGGVREQRAPGPPPGSGLLRGVRLVAAAMGELAASAGAPGPRTVLNRPVAAGMRLVVADVDLDTLRAGARSCGATVNDAVLAVVGGLMHAELVRAGAPVTRLVAGCPVTVPDDPQRAAGRRDPSGAAMANRVGVVRLPVPARLPGESVAGHLSRVAAITRPRKRNLSAASTLVLSPVFRALAALGLYRPMVERQRTINLLVTNVRGPVHAPRLCGREVRAVLPVTPIVGNVPLAAVALSFAGRLSVTIRLASALWDREESLRAGLEAGLEEIASLSVPSLGD